MVLSKRRKPTRAAWLAPPSPSNMLNSTAICQTDPTSLFTVHLEVRINPGKVVPCVQEAAYGTVSAIHLTSAGAGKPISSIGFEEGLSSDILL